ncbi:MAG: oligosaccharide flippase family protein [Bacteroidetes bacterium]|nr:oligosaccharide flippase family protein [Bacteroidota bacterium]
MGIIFVPVYLKYLGTETYGLIGVFMSLQVIFSVLDGGLGSALTKEIAQRSSYPAVKENKIGDLVKTLGTIYWMVAVIAGVFAILISPLLAGYWVKPVNLTYYDVVEVFILLSMSLIFLLPSGFYSGGLIGLQKHLTLNILKVIFALVKNGGAVVVLIFSSEKLITFFTWNLIVNALQSLVFKMTLWKYIGKERVKAKFNWQEFASVRKYALGITRINITALILTQVDRIVLSKILPLNQFGCYTLAGSIAVFIYQIIQPINQSFFPRFAALTGSSDKNELRQVYQLAYQVVSLLIIPAFLILAFFSEELLYLVTSDVTLTQSTKIILSVLAVANGLNSLLNIPYQLSLAYGWTKYSFYQNILLIITLTPLTIYLSLHYSALGGAVSWLILNIIILITGSIIIHKRLIRDEILKWYMYGLSLPLVLNTGLVWIFREISGWDMTNKFLTIIIVFSFGIICLTFNSILLPEIRKRIIGFKLYRQ